jgi:hypothetical protein
VYEETQEQIDFSDADGEDDSFDYFNVRVDVTQDNVASCGLFTEAAIQRINERLIHKPTTSRVKSKG